LIFIRQDNREKAIKDFNRAIKLNSQNPIYFAVRGAWYKLEGLFQKALEDLNNAILLDDQESDFYRQRGLVYVKKRDFQKAELDYNQANKLGQNNDPDFFEERARLYYELGNLELESENLEKAMQYPNCPVDVYIMFGDNCIGKKDYHKAIKCLDIGVSLFPSDSRLYHMRSVAKVNIGQRKSALKDANKAIILDEDRFEFYSIRSAIYETLGSKGLAKRDADKALELENRVNEKEI